MMIMNLMERTLEMTMRYTPHFILLLRKDPAKKEDPHFQTNTPLRNREIDILPF